MITPIDRVSMEGPRKPRPRSPGRGSFTCAGSLVELVHDGPKRRERVLRELAMERLVVVGAQGLAVLSLADLVPPAGDLLAYRVRRHRRPAQRRRGSREEAPLQRHVGRRDLEEL